MSEAISDVVVEADGGSRGNPGPAGYGAVVLDPAGGAVLAERKESIGVETNNVAEYRGLIAGLEAAVELGARRVAVRMDSKLVVEQMSGRWQVKNENLRPLARRAADLVRRFESVSFSWVPRAQNTAADRLANEAMDAAAGIVRARGAQTSTGPNGSATVRPAGGTAAAVPVSAWAPPTGPATRLLLVRHGSTAHSAEQRFSGRNELPLDVPGTAQAAALAARLQREPRIAAVVASPLRRAVQTADWIAAALGLHVSTDADLAEVDFGAWEGLTMAEAVARDREAVAAWTASPDVPPPEGESFTALARRVRRARDRLIATYPDARIVVVTHVSPIKILVRLALDAPPAAMYGLHLDTASVSAIDYFADGRSSLRLFNETTHLA